MAFGRSRDRTYIDIDTSAAVDLLGTVQARAYVEAIAKQGAQALRDLTPTDADKVVSGGGSIVNGVATAYFGSTSSIWHIIEFGSVNNPPYRPMTQAAERIGLRFRVDGEGDA